MDRFAEKISDQIDSLSLRMKKFNPLTFVKRAVFGVRAKGEPIPEPRLRTLTGENQPSEFEWYQEFKVGSLHGRTQRIHFGQ